MRVALGIISRLDWTKHLDRRGQTSRSWVAQAVKGKLGSWVEMPCVSVCV